MPVNHRMRLWFGAARCRLRHVRRRAVPGRGQRGSHRHPVRPDLSAGSGGRGAGLFCRRGEEGGSSRSQGHGAALFRLAGHHRRGAFRKCRRRRVRHAGPADRLGEDQGTSGRRRSRGFGRQRIYSGNQQAADQIARRLRRQRPDRRAGHDLAAGGGDAHGGGKNLRRLSPPRQACSSACRIPTRRRPCSPGRSFPAMWRRRRLPRSSSAATKSTW